MLSTQSLTVISPAVLVLLTGRVFPFGEAVNWICHPSSGGQEWNMMFSFFAGQVSWIQKGWSSGDARGHAGRVGSAAGCALGIWGAPMWKGSTAVWGLKHRWVYGGQLWAEACTKLSEIPAIKLCSRVFTRSQPSRPHLHLHTPLYLPVSRAILSDL